MSDIHTGMSAAALTGVTWVKSQRSGPTGGNCVEIAFLAGGEVAMRNSRHPAGPALDLHPGRVGRLHRRRTRR